MSEQVKGTEVVIVQGQLRKIIHQEGEGQCPRKGQEVSALYRGTLQTGQEFDSNQSRDSPFTFKVGTGSVIKGWDQGFITMKRGEKATLICSPEFAYGQRGSPPRIPPNSTLHFEVELLDFKDVKKEKWELEGPEKVAEALKLKESGNSKLKQKKYKAAIKDYKEGIQYLQGEDEQEAKDLLKVLRLNSAQACLASNQGSEAIKHASKVLEDEPENQKALYRRGSAYLQIQDFERAKIDFAALLKVDPANIDAKTKLTEAGAIEKQYKAKQKKVFGGMFAQPGLYEDKKIEPPKPKEDDDDDDGLKMDQEAPEDEDKPEEKSGEAGETPVYIEEIPPQ